jgi:hypothetical protein
LNTHLLLFLFQISNGYIFFLLPLFSLTNPPGTGNTGALHVYQDVCSRTMILGMLMKDSSGTIGMLTGEAVPPVDFGPRVMNAVKALQQVCPMEDVMAGMMR